MQLWPGGQGGGGGGSNLNMPVISSSNTRGCPGRGGDLNFEIVATSLRD